MKNKLVAAFHITTPYARKYGPWMTMSTSFAIIAHDLMKKN